MEDQSIEDRVAGHEAKIAGLEERLKENTDLLMKFAQLSSGLMAAISVAFENHTHDSGGYVFLPEDTKAMYEEMIPQEMRRNDHDGPDR